MSDVPGNVENVRNLLNHPAFDLRNPNKASDISLSCKHVRGHMHKDTVVPSLQLKFERCSECALFC